MAISVVTRKLLWGRAGNRCAFESCHQRLTVDLKDPESAILADNGAVIGEEAHIRSGAADGPRHDPTYPREQIDGYENLILLCPTHHTIIDKDGEIAWSVAQLEGIKANHELAVDSHRSALDHSRQMIEERLAASISLWEEKLGVRDWENLTFNLNFPVPMISPLQRGRLVDLARWLLAKSWPPDHPKLKKAFVLHREVVTTLATHMAATFYRNGDDRWEMEREYKGLTGWDPSMYKKLFDEFDLNCATLWHLVAEATKSANLVVTAIQNELDPLYRFDDGILLMSDGDGVIHNALVRLEYNDFDWDSIREYPTIDEIKKAIRQKAAVQACRCSEINLYELQV